MKNYLSEDFFDLTKQLFRKMRTTCLMILVFASSLYASNVNSQVAKVSIAMKNTYIIEVIRAIETQTDYLFVYDKNEIDLTRKVDLVAENKSVADILSGIFNSTNVVYAIEGNNIMLMAKHDFQQQQQKISNIKEPNLKFASAFKILDRRQVAAFPQKVECHNLASRSAEPFAQMTPMLRGGIVLLCLQ